MMRPRRDASKVPPLNRPRADQGTARPGQWGAGLTPQGDTADVPQPGPLRVPRASHRPHRPGRRSPRRAGPAGRLPARPPFQVIVTCPGNGGIAEGKYLKAFNSAQCPIPCSRSHHACLASSARERASTTTGTAVNDPRISATIARPCSRAVRYCNEGRPYAIRIGSSPQTPAGHGSLHEASISSEAGEQGAAVARGSTSTS